MRWWQGLKDNQVEMVIVAQDCDDGKCTRSVPASPVPDHVFMSAANYAEGLKAYCAKKGIFMLRAVDMQQLGEYSGLYEEDKDHNPIKVRPTGAVAIKDFGSEVPRPPTRRRRFRCRL